jgi:hypothetical protein
MAMMVSLQKRLRTETDGPRKRQFFAQYLTMSSGRQVELEDWTVTSYEVERQVLEHSSEYRVLTDTCYRVSQCEHSR